MYRKSNLQPEELRPEPGLQLIRGKLNDPFAGARWLTRYTPASSTFKVRFAEYNGSKLDQNDEWIEVSLKHNNGSKENRRIRIHDYLDIYSIPGLYEEIVANKLKCDSPRNGAELLIETVKKYDPALSSHLSILDVASGIGIVAEELKKISPSAQIVGTDLLLAAKAAALRDRPDAYRNYLVLDLVDPTDAEVRMLRSYRFNSMICLGALSYGIPTQGFKNAFNLVRDRGFVCFDVKDELYDGSGNKSSIDAFIREMQDSGSFELLEQRHNFHRNTVDGRKLHYVCISGRKLCDLCEAAP